MIRIRRLLALALAFAALACSASFPSSSRATSILPLRSEEAALLIGVDSARTSVMTMVAVPGNDARLHPDRPVRRLIGTAVVLSPHRLLTTASMAIPGGLFSVLVGDGLKRRAELRGVDRQSNVALFSVEGAPLPPLRQASPQSIAPGSWVAVISNVNVTRPQITLGQVAARGERVDFPYSGDIVEIEATTAPGASGGAVLNEAGDWVAIVVGRAGKEPPRAAAPVVQPGDPGAAQQPADLLIALPVDQLQRIADDLEQYGSVRHAFLGIQMRRGILPDSLGALVDGVVPKSPAATAGLQPGDRILAFEGNVIHSAEEITSLVGSFRPGDEIEMTISRGNDIFPVRTTLDAAVRAPALRPHSDRDAELKQLHQSLETLESETKQVEERIHKLEGSR
ncbi:MAG: PDZ domain-containing protein [Candidatus Eisenbacteria bacterium]|uniref:PDZ domain-containing protein n=1 Tax=Eiseniibacteriota bacterium TaxID=2212470 RepID=A0A538SF30_UNCEI|nr:MAG: PDZ domain-containing protein [Candidatus Eisenbacteria bacterium]